MSNRPQVLLVTAIAQNGYEYNKPGKPFGQVTNRPGFIGYPTSTAGYPSTPQEEYTATTPGYTPGQSTYPNYRPQVGQQGSNYPGQNPSLPTSYPLQPETNFPSQPVQNYPGQEYPIQQGGRPQGFRPNRPAFPGPVEHSFDNGAYEGGDYSAIPGEPGVDYPIYSVAPPTSFRCEAQSYPGYYADLETRCQAFHVCANNITYDFLCPNGTIFSQEVFVCVWWNQFDCNSAPALYELNANLYDYSIMGSSGGNRFPQGPGFYPGSGLQNGISRPEGPSSNFPGASPTYPSSVGYPGTSPTIGYTGGSYSTTPSYPGSTVTQGISSYPGPQEIGNYPGAQYPTLTDPGVTPQNNYPGSQDSLGYSTVRPENQGYPSGKPTGPRFPLGPSRPQNPSNTGYGVPQPNREYLPPIN
ncbi:unnamed protein product [Leptidea sinapis]|uniref:Chitin-binding type-2 domain-containing protein n=1 Tax=Leptidea sinapis TaxID=189913 RepID=A0A5E4PWD7_9NEOP|nr:unnamed protein product [Leptidea sinapis]